jgi:hypothetical protein
MMIDLNLFPVRTARHQPLVGRSFVPSPILSLDFFPTSAILTSPTLPLSSRDIERAETHQSTYTHVHPNSPPPSIPQSIAMIYSRKGLAGFWAGIKAALILVTNPVLQVSFFPSASLPPDRHPPRSFRSTSLQSRADRAIFPFRER